MFTLEFTYRFETAHRFVTGTTKCTTPHGHTWQATLGFEAPGGALDEAHMVAEFEKLKADWRNFIQGTADHSFFHHYQDPLLSAFRDHIPDFRGLAFPGDPTTELIAALFLEKAIAMRPPGGLLPSFVLVQETPSNRLRFTREGLVELRARLGLGTRFRGWWEDAEPSSRRFAEAGN